MCDHSGGHSTKSESSSAVQCAKAAQTAPLLAAGGNERHGRWLNVLCHEDLSVLHPERFIPAGRAAAALTLLPSAPNLIRFQHIIRARTRVKPYAILLHQMPQKPGNKGALLCGTGSDEPMVFPVVDHMKQQLLQIPLLRPVHSLECQSDQGRHVVHEAFRRGKAQRVPAGIPSLLQANGINVSGH
jgi:hypothetical protein